MFEVNMEVNDDESVIRLWQWALDKGDIPWNPDIFIGLVCANRLELVKWAHSHGCPWPMYFVYLSQFRLNESLLWCYENGCPWADHARYLRQIEVNEAYIGPLGNLQPHAKLEVCRYFRSFMLCRPGHTTAIEKTVWDLHVKTNIQPFRLLIGVPLFDEVMKFL